MKRFNTFITIISVALTAMLVVACVSRDPQAEYEALCSTVFSDPQDGLDQAQEYIDYFYGEKKARTKEVTDIRNKYKEMVGFFSMSHNSYGDFMTESDFLNLELSTSPYEGVRKTWNSLYKQTRNRLVTPLLDKINEQLFDEYFMTQANQLFDLQDYSTWVPTTTERVLINTPRVKSDGTTKECSGKYRIYCQQDILRLGVKKRNDYAEIEITGEIGVDEAGGYTYKIISHNFTKEPFF